MTDEIDMATDTIQRELENQIAHSRNALVKRELQPNGHCYYCNYPVDELRIFCDRECAEDYEAFYKRKR